MAINEALAMCLEQYHKGEANAVTSRELECTFQMRGSELRREINALRGDGIPICSFEGGYYYAATVEELERTIRQLRSRIKKIAFAERGLSSALPDYVDTGQLSLPLDGVTPLEQLYPLGGRQEQAAVDHQQDGAGSLQPVHRCLRRQRHGDHEPPHSAGLHGSLQRFQQRCTTGFCCISDWRG